MLLPTRYYIVETLDHISISFLYIFIPGFSRRLGTIKTPICQIFDWHYLAIVQDSSWRLFNSRLIPNWLNYANLAVCSQGKNCNCDKRRCHARSPAFPCDSHTPKNPKKKAQKKTQGPGHKTKANQTSKLNFSSLISIKRRFAMAKKILMLSFSRCRLGCRRPRLLVTVIRIHIYNHIVIVIAISSELLLLLAASVDFQFLM